MKLEHEPTKSTEQNMHKGNLLAAVKFSMLSQIELVCYHLTLLVSWCNGERLKESERPSVHGLDISCLQSQI